MIPVKKFFELIQEHEIRQFTPEARKAYNEISSLTDNGTDWRVFDNNIGARKKIIEQYEIIMDSIRIIKKKKTKDDLEGIRMPEPLITIHNYFDKIRLGWIKTVPELARGHYLMYEASENHWEKYHKDYEMQLIVDLHLLCVNMMLAGRENHEFIIDSPLNALPIPQKKRGGAAMVEDIPTDIKIIRRYRNLHGRRDITKPEVWTFITSIRRHLAAKRIDEDSRYAKLIDAIQQELLNKYDSRSERVTVRLTDQELQQLDAILGHDIELRPAAMLLKKFIGMCGKVREGKQLKGLKARANTLLNKIVFFVLNEHEKPRHERDPYLSELENVIPPLSEYVLYDAKKIPMMKGELHGCKELLNGWGKGDDDDDDEDINGLDLCNEGE